MYSFYTFVPFGTGLSVQSMLRYGEGLGFSDKTGHRAVDPMRQRKNSRQLLTELSRRYSCPLQHSDHRSWWMACERPAALSALPLSRRSEGGGTTHGRRRILCRSEETSTVQWVPRKYIHDGEDLEKLAWLPIHRHYETIGPSGRR